MMGAKTALYDLKRLPFTILRQTYVDPKTDCWLWSGGCTNAGYGLYWDVDKKAQHSVHRSVYQLLVGPIPKNEQLVHLCREKRCCNPAHLRIGDGIRKLGEHVKMGMSQPCSRQEHEGCFGTVAQPDEHGNYGLESVMVCECTCHTPIERTIQVDGSDVTYVYVPKLAVTGLVELLDESVRTITRKQRQEAMDSLNETAKLISEHGYTRSPKMDD